MQDLLDIVSDRSEWKHIQPVVHETFTRITELFQKFNNKLAFIENTIYSKEKQRAQGEENLARKTVSKQGKVKWKSPIREVIEYEQTRKCNQKREEIKDGKHERKVANKREVFPQQLYLQSNETMFAMLVQEIEKIKGRMKQQKKQKQKKKEKPEKSTKRIIEIVGSRGESLEKVKRLEIRQIWLEQQMQTLISYVNTKIQSSLKSHTAPIIPQVINFPSSPPPYPSDLPIKLFQLQRHLLSLPTLPTITSLLQSLLSTHTSQLSLSIQQLSQYTQTNLISINKILTHQSSINLQVCRELKIGKWIWEGRERTKLGLVPWEKEVVNLFPESVGWSEGSTALVVKEGGVYRVEVWVLGQGQGQGGVGVIVGEESYEGRGNGFNEVMEITSGVSLSVASECESTTVVLILQKVM